MRNLKVSIKLVVSFSIVIVLAVLLAGAGLWGMKEIKDASDNMYRFNVKAMEAIGSIRENFALQRYTTRELVIFDASSDEYSALKKTLINLETEMDTHIAMYTQTMINEDDIALFEEFQKTYYDIYAPFKVVLLGLTDNNQTESVMELIRTSGIPIVNSISDILHKAYITNTTIAKDALNQNTSLYASLTKIEIAVLVFAVLIVVLMVVYMTNSISKPIKRLSSSLDYMGSTGNLMLNDTMFRFINQASARRDEIGMAARSIINLLNHIWRIEHVLARISDGDFAVDIKLLSDQDTIGMSVAKVADNLNRLFQNLESAEKTAQAASKAKGDFLANMSHEIRTPLNAIMGMALIAKKSVDDREKLVSSIDQITKSSRHLLRILNGVLDMSKIESGKLELSSEPFCFHEAFQEVDGIISQSCSAKGITFTTNLYDLKDMILVGDKMRLNQVLINLLSNAVKFTNESGQINLDIAILHEDDENVHLQYSVSDTGIGMSQEQLARLFKPFEQTDTTIAARFGGTGLGLSISWNMIAMMGGTITVSSEPGKGSTFVFDLWLARGQDSDLTQGSTADQALDLHDKHLLLVDDVDINRMIICDLLEETGIQIDEAENGEQAVGLYRQSPEGFYDIIAMDVQMPVLDGYGAARAIRKAQRSDAKQVPIIAMTASAYNDDVKRCLAAGMDGHISKPIDYDAMIKTFLGFLK